MKTIVKLIKKMIKKLPYFREVFNERDNLRDERNILRNELNNLRNERDALRGERDALINERDILRDEQMRLAEELHHLKAGQEVKTGGNRYAKDWNEYSKTWEQKFGSKYSTKHHHCATQRNSMRYIKDAQVDIDKNVFVECLQASDTYIKRSEAGKLYIDSQIERLYRIFKNMLLAPANFRGPSLDVASGWGILFPCFRKFFKDMLPYYIAELHLNSDVVYDGEKIVGCKFECDKDILEFADSTFGTVVFCDCLEHLIVDPVWTFLEFNRVLRLGGHLIITTPNAAAAFRVINILKGGNPATESAIKPSSIYQRHNREWTPTEVENIVKCCGFDNCLFSTNDSLLSKDEINLLEVVEKLGILRKPINEFGPELFLIAEKVEHRTLQSNLSKEQRWPEWLYTSFDEYRKRPNIFPIIIGDDYS